MEPEHSSYFWAALGAVGAALIAGGWNLVAKVMGWRRIDTQASAAAEIADRSAFRADLLQRVESLGRVVDHQQDEMAALKVDAATAKAHAERCEEELAGARRRLDSAEAKIKHLEGQDR